MENITFSPWRTQAMGDGRQAERPRGRMASTSWARSDRGPVFHTISGPVPAWESLLLQLPEELARVDALLDDPAFFARSRSSRQ